MEIQIRKNIIALYNRIVDYNLELETRQFALLTADKQDAILLETYQRVFKGFWNSPTRVTNFKKDSATKCEEDEEKVLTSVISVASQNRAVNYTAELNFKYIPSKNNLKITVSKENARSRKAQNAYTTCLNKELNDFKETFEQICSPMHFVKAFFTTLKAHHLSEISGRGAEMLYTIFTKACKHYPLFDNLPYSQQVALIQKGFLRGMNEGKRDIYLYSKTTFEVLRSENLIAVLANVDEFNSVYYEVSENVKNRRNPDNHSEVWEYNYLVFVTYEYTIRGTVSMRTSFSADTLWNFLN